MVQNATECYKITLTTIIVFGRRLFEPHASDTIHWCKKTVISKELLFIFFSQSPSIKCFGASNDREWFLGQNLWKPFVLLHSESDSWWDSNLMSGSFFSCNSFSFIFDFPPWTVERISIMNDYWFKNQSLISSDHACSPFWRLHRPWSISHDFKPNFPL